MYKKNIWHVILQVQVKKIKITSKGDCLSDVPDPNCFTRDDRQQHPFSEFVRQHWLGDDQWVFSIVIVLRKKKARSDPLATSFTFLPITFQGNLTSPPLV